MAIDKTLIQGAGKAVKQFDYGADAIMKASEQLGKSYEKMTDKVNEAREEWQTLAQEAIDKGEDLSDEQFDQVLQELNADRESYIWGNSTDRAKLMRGLNQRIESLGENQVFIDELATSVKMSGDGESGLRPEFLVSPAGEELKDIMAGKAEMVQRGKNYGYYITDQDMDIEARVAELESEEFLEDGSQNPFYEGAVDIPMDALNDTQRAVVEQREALKAGKRWTSVNDLREIVQKNSNNTELRDGINDQVTEMMEISKNIQPGANTDFPREQYRQWVDQNLTIEPNINSLINDPHLGNQSFKNNLISYITGNDWDSLGIDKKTASSMGLKNRDVNNDGRIDEEDARAIVGEFTKKQNGKYSIATKDLLSRYYTQHFETKWGDMAQYRQGQTAKSKFTQKQYEHWLDKSEKNPNIFGTPDGDSDQIYSPDETTTETTTTTTTTTGLTKQQTLGFLNDTSISDEKKKELLAEYNKNNPNDKIDKSSGFAWWRKWAGDGPKYD